MAMATIFVVFVVIATIVVIHVCPLPHQQQVTTKLLVAMDQAHRHELIKDCRNCDLEFLPPLPPPSFSSNSSSGLTASIASVIAAILVLPVGITQAAGYAECSHDVLEYPDGQC
jgi:hypothetical protein